MARVLTCDEGDFNATTGECAAPYYSQQAGAWPALPSVEDSFEIGAAIALLWTVAYCWKAMGRVLDSAKPTNHSEE